MNQRPSGYEPDELPDCSIPRYLIVICDLLFKQSSRLTSPQMILNHPRRQSIPRYLIVICDLLFKQSSRLTSPQMILNHPRRQSIPRYLIVRLSKPYRHNYYQTLNLKNQPSIISLLKILCIMLQFFIYTIKPIMWYNIMV